MTDEVPNKTEEDRRGAAAHAEDLLAIRRRILNTVQDAVSDLLYYDRKEDMLLPVGAIEQAVKAGALTVEDIANEFRLHLLRGIQP